LTLYAEFRYLLAEVLLRHFLLIFTNSMHKIRNSRILYFLLSKGDTVAYWQWHSMNTPLN